MTWIFARTTVVALALALALSVPAFVVPAAASASASGASVTGGVLTVAAPGSSDANVVTITSSNGSIVVADQGVAAVAAGAGCKSTGPREVSCSATGITSIAVELGDGDDSASVSLFSVPVAIDGGPGNDMIAGGAMSDRLVGGPGSDTISGGWGDDLLDGGAGGDRLLGNGGVDTVSYADRTASVKVTLDTTANDGEPGEGDEVVAENLQGGAGDDLLTGDSDPNRLSGGGGADVLSGASGADTIDGGAGLDDVDGGAGADAISLRDGETDAATCGSEADAVAADPGDLLATDCESVDRSAQTVTTTVTVATPPPPPPAPDTTPPPAAAPAGAETPSPAVDTPRPTPPPNPHPRAPLTDPPAVEIGRRTATASPSGVVGIGLSCPDGSTGACVGDLVVTMNVPVRALERSRQRVDLIRAARRRKVVKISKGRRKFQIAAGESKSVPVRLSRRGRTALGHRNKLVVRAWVSVKDGNGDTITTSRAITVRAARRGVRRSGRR